MRPPSRLQSRVRTACACALLVGCLSSIGQDLSPPAPNVVVESMEKVRYTGTPLDQVMKDYGDLTDKTPMIEPGLSASITLESQTELSTKERLVAIESILSMNGIALVPFGEKFVKVVRAENARSIGMATELDDELGKPEETDKLISRVVIMKNMDIAEAQKIIDGLKGKQAKIQTLDRINGLLITDNAVNVARILEMLDEIDQPVVTREKLFVHPVRYAKPSEIKGKLEEIIKDLSDKPETSTPTVARPRPAGPPGVIRAQPESVATTVPEGTSAGGEDEKGIVRGKVKIIADDRTGILVFITMPSNMEFFQDIIKALDVETAPDVMVKVYRLEFAEADTVAGMLNSLIGAQTTKDQPVPGAPAGTPGAPESENKGVALDEYIRARKSAEAAESVPGQKSKIGELSAQNVKILSDKRTNALIIMASKSDHSALDEIIRDMDMMLSQVLIEAVIIEIKLSDTLKTGIDWVQKSLVAYNTKNGSRNPIGAFTGRGGGGTLSPADATTLTPGPAGGGIAYYFTHYGLNVDAVVSAAANDSRTRVVSAPVILTTDNTEAKIASTESIYVYKGVTYPSGNTSVQPYQDYGQDQVGLTLTVKPHINKSKIVMMEINQSMSEPGEEGAPQSGKKVKSERTLTASIAVADRETIILGGQVRNDSSISRAGIPLISKIPLLGRLFSNESDVSSRTEMIVFITPYVLDTPDQIAAESLRRKRALDVQKLWQRGWSDSKLAEPTSAMKRAEKKAKRAEDRTKRDEDERAQEAAEKALKEAPVATAEDMSSAPVVTGDDGRNYAVVGEPTESIPEPAPADRFNAAADRWKNSLDEVDRVSPKPEPDDEFLPEPVR